jgi:hypothetical protein
MARTRFANPDTTIVVSTDGYFDVYPAVPRSNNDKPVYRGRLGELGPGIRGTDERLLVSTTSSKLRDAVAAWSDEHGAAAVRGDLGRSRYSGEIVA